MASLSPTHPVLEPVMNLGTAGGLEPSADQARLSFALVLCGFDAGL